MKIVPSTLQRHLQQYFGYSEFRPQQLDVINAVLSGQDCLAILPTGSGKSLCYQLPALSLSGVVIVISPLIALMQDQVTSLKNRDIQAEAYHSSITQAEQGRIEDLYLQNSLRLLYVSPERLLSPLFLGFISRGRPALFVVDEAHCMDRWGTEFRPEYLKLALISERFPNVPLLALTATADRVSEANILRFLGRDKMHVIRGSLNRENLNFTVQKKDNHRQQILHCIQSHSNLSGIIFCRTRNRVEDVSSWLSKQGIACVSYHAGMDSQSRQLSQRTFLESSNTVMVATIAFGMGIDKPDVRYIIHVDPPASIEAYYQEVGRAGRDGQPATCLLLYGLQDCLMTLRAIQLGGGQTESRDKFLQLMRLLNGALCRRRAILSAFGEDLKSPCGVCDICLEPPSEVVVTHQARLALSCVYRARQSFGVQHLIDILLGKCTPKVLLHEHQHLSVFSLGISHTQGFWKDLFKTLIADGLLQVDASSGLTLCLHPDALPVLRGEREILMACRPDLT